MRGKVKAALLLVVMLVALTPIETEAAITASITYCAKDGGGACTNFRGIDANMDVFWPQLQANGGEHVSSVYIWVDAYNYVEFGWYQKRATFNTGPRRIFVASRVNDTPPVTANCPGTGGNRLWETDLTTNGDWRWGIYQNSGSNTFRFRAIRPNGTTVTSPCTVTAWFAGAFAITATEIGKQGPFEDEPALYHKNVWTLGAAWDWHPANPSFFPMGLRQDNMTYFAPLRLAGSGATGDQINYVGA